MKTDVIKSKIYSSDIEVFIQNNDGLCTMLQLKDFRVS